MFLNTTSKINMEINTNLKKLFFGALEKAVKESFDESEVLL